MNGKNYGSIIKIALVNPRLEGPYPPLGLAYLASYLKRYGQNNYEIKIIDGNCSNNILGGILKFNPSIVGLTALSPQIKDAVELSINLRREKPGIFQIIGGVHVSADPENTLRKAGFDLAVIGEGEKTFKEAVDGYLKYGKDRTFYSKLEGIAFLDNTKLVCNPSGKEIEQIDAICPPERSLLNMNHYLSKYLIIRGLLGNRIATIHTSRGCPYNCVFCSCNIISKKVRYFSVDYVAAEIKDLIDRYKVKSIFFTDDTFILNKERVREICQRFIDEGINKKVKWEVQGRANLIDWPDLDMLKLMKEAGCIQIDYGFETGSEDILKFLKKRDVSIAYNRRAMEVTKAAGLKVMGTFMVGIPGETDEDMELTKKFILENKGRIDNFQCFIATPYPGAELYDICREKGIVSDNYFDQIEKEKERGFIPFYSNTVSYEKAVETQKFLNKLAVRKIKLSDKFSWFLFNFIKDPAATVRKICNSLD